MELEKKKKKNRFLNDVWILFARKSVFSHSVWRGEIFAALSPRVYGGGPGTLFAHGAGKIFLDLFSRTLAISAGAAARVERGGATTASSEPQPCGRWSAPSVPRPLGAGRGPDPHGTVCAGNRVVNFIGHKYFTGPSHWIKKRNNKNRKYIYIFICCLCPLWVL